ncbi:MAG: phosphoenolpyruvate carboxykinase (GTP), partial [Candidatus Omnitrophica bacterium]|nr:phosphoenolpyruvate carboxykinase (GTP) [Candidatus Omnitrophota bacterium]
FVGATMASETTAAATGKVGVVRRDPMAMLPFCGYHMGDYFGHWLKMGKKIKNPPKIFHVNWFRTNEQGKFIWPGYGENLRVLKWIVERSLGRVEAVQTPIGYMPRPEDILLEGASVSAEMLKSQLLTVDKKEWEAEVQSQNEFFSKLGDALPKEIRSEQEALLKRLRA